MRKQFLLISCLCCCSYIFAQQNDDANADTSWKNIYRAQATKINDLVNTKLDVRFDFSKSYLFGKEWLTAHPHFFPTDSLTLDAKGMNINEVDLFSNGKKTPLKYVYDDSMFLRITLNKTYKAGENYTVYIDYVSKPDEWHREDGSSAITSAKGLFFINPRGEEKNKPTEIWTQGETEHNSVWMPTIDKPDQKSTEEIAMTVPDKYVTLSNGLLTSQKKNADGTRTDTWREDLPNTQYLYFMGVGEYSIVKDNYKGKDVNYYVEKEYAPEARAIFGHTPDMIKFYSTVLGVDYPWQKYDQIVGRDYVSGAMENTTCTLHEEAAYQNFRQLKDGNAWEDVIAHELFHQWFGDLVTCESWSNITMNESFADFSETIWEEHEYGKDAGDDHNYEAQQEYLGSPDAAAKPLVRFHYGDKEDVFDVVSYQKGGRILNMLRHYLGDSAFFKSLNKYLTDNKFGNGEAQQLRLAFESVTGQDLNWYWNEWYYGTGHPVLDINYVYNDTSHTVKVIVQQKQTQQIFKMPVNIDVYNGANKKRYQVWLQNSVDTFTFSYVQRPDLVNFDGDKILLCQKTDHKTADNYRAQWKFAPLYVDRREALAYFAKNNLLNELTLGLNDKYAPLRSYTLDKLTANQTVLTNQTILTQVQRLATSDPDSKTKAKATSLLVLTKDAAYKTVYDKNINDSSYSVSGAALDGLSSLDSANAYSLAKKYAADAKGKLGEAVTNIIITQGSETDYNNVEQAYKNMPPNQAKLKITSAFCSYLSKLSDPQKIKGGIDDVVAFRNMIPEAYRSYTDPSFKAGLQTIADAKGSDLQAYINNAMK